MLLKLVACIYRLTSVLEDPGQGAVSHAWKFRIIVLAGLIFRKLIRPLAMATGACPHERVVWTCVFAC